MKQFSFFLKRENRMKSKKFYLAGLVASFAYIIAVILGGIMWPAYSHLRQAISELTMTTAPNQWLIQPLFLIYNLSLLIFAIYLFKKAMNKPLKISAILLSLVGFSGLLMYFFPQDPLNVALTFDGLMHFVLAGMEALGTIVAIYLGGSGLAKATSDRQFKFTSVFLGSVVLICGGATPYIMSALPNYFGVFERITIGSFILWLGIFSYKLYKEKNFEKSKTQ